MVTIENVLDVRDIYLIDTENVNPEFMNQVHSLNDNDLLVLMYTKNSKRIDYKSLSHLMSSDCLVVFEEANCGTPNALDFQLVTVLGYLIRKFPNSRYVIHSCDSGFDAVTTFWRTKGVSICRRPQFQVSKPIIKISDKIEKLETSDDFEKVNIDKSLSLSFEIEAAKVE